MAQILEMPRLSDTMQEGRVIKWHKKEGDRIAPGDVIAEIETDKANMDFEAFDAGVLLKILVEDGGTAPVGGPVAILGQPGEDVSALLAQASAGGKAQPAPAAAQQAERQVPAAPTAPVAPAATAAAQPQPAASPEAARAPAPPPRPAPSPAPSPARAPATTGGNGHGRILASPLARRLADELGVNLRQLRGSGPGGRIVKGDVERAAGQPGRAAASEPAPETPAPQATRGPAPAAAPPATSAPPAAQSQSLSMMRKTIARRMVEAKQQAPHFYLTAQADMDAAVAFRAQVNEALGVKISFNDLVIKACALALRRVPQVNASFAGDHLVLHPQVHIGVAVAIEDGLITPVVHDADVKSLGAIAREVQELAARARERKLRPEEYTGSTFSVSNLGMFGVEEFAAIINPPEAGILAVGAVRKQPVVKDDDIVVGHRMKVTLSGDHRTIDGATGARFLQEVLRILEHPMTLAM
jgi:pyruvate dehydrogenase E2 component (dihydrolipoamide acetyltransferase)